MEAKPYQHPRLTKAKARFVTYAPYLRVVEAMEVADARRAAREKELQQKDEYLQKRNERLRLHVKHNMQYLPSQDPMLNGHDKEEGVKHAMELSEVPAPARSFYQYDARVIDLFGPLVQHHLPSVAGSRH
jgi:hypothetical protein